MTGVTLNATSKTLYLNTTFQLEATIAPANATDKSVTWTSSNSSVATVSSDGLVTAGNTEGTAIITVTTKDGNKTATCDITVQEAPSYVEMWTGSKNANGLTGNIDITEIRPQKTFTECLTEGKTTLKLYYSAEGARTATSIESDWQKADLSTNVSIPAGNSAIEITLDQTKASNLDKNKKITLHLNTPNANNYNLTITKITME